MGRSQKAPIVGDHAAALQEREGETQSDSSQAFPTWLPLVILVGAIALIFYRLILGEVLFWGLPSLQFQPWRDFASAELHAGRLALWSPYNGGGEPLFANYQSAILYPPNLLSLLIVPGPQALGWLGMLHLFWAGLGMWFYTRQLGLSPLAQGIGTLAFALNGAVVARLGTLPMVEVAAWLPWLLLATERLLRQQSIANILSLTAVTALQLLAGHAQWTFYSLILVALYTFYRVFAAPIGLQTGQRQPITLVVLGMGIALAAGIAAVQLLPVAELQHSSQRANGADESFALNFSDNWPGLIMQFDPQFFGNPGDGTYAIGGAQFEIASYVGILPVILAFVVIIYSVRRWRLIKPVRTSNLPIALVPFFSGVALIGHIFAFGSNSTLYLFLFRHVPTFNQFQAPARWLLWTVCGLSILGAIGASVWQPSRLMVRRSRLLLTGAFGVAAIGLFLTIAEPGILARGILTIGILFSAVGIAFLTQPSPARQNAHRLWAIAVLLFVAGDLIWADALLNPSTSADFYTPRQDVGESLSQRTFQSDAAIDKAEFGIYLQFRDYRVAGQRQSEYRAAGFPEMNILDRQPSYNLFEPLHIDWVNRFTQLLDTQPRPALYQAAATGTASDPNPPRVWLVGSLKPVPDPFAAISDLNWQPYTVAYVETGTPGLNGTVSPSDSVQMDSETPQEIHFTAHTSGPAALIVADTWYPGWQAWIDGTSIPIYRANGAFRAVVVPMGGDHTILMRYQPQSLTLGAGVSSVSVVIWVSLGIANRWQKRRSAILSA